MTLHLGDLAPDFTADTTRGPVRFHDWLGGGWGILFSHPADFTPVCTTELGAVARLGPEFAARGVKVIGLSVDTVDSHLRWEVDVAATQGTLIDFPMIADVDRSVAQAYDMIHPGASDVATVRTVFVVDPEKRVRLILAYPMSTGRNFDEILRAVDSLQLTDSWPVATPADWRPGEDVIIGLGIDGTEAASLFPGYRGVRPYLRFTEDPDVRHTPA